MSAVGDSGLPGNGGKKGVFACILSGRKRI
jgi:hypothetical protein